MVPECYHLHPCNLMARKDSGYAIPRKETENYLDARPKISRLILN